MCNVPTRDSRQECRDSVVASLEGDKGVKEAGS